MNTDFNLICSAQANPPAKYRFYKEQESLFNTTTGSNVAEHTTSVTERINQVQFSCTPFNDLYGDGPTDTITVTVHCEYTTVTSTNDSIKVLYNGAQPCWCDKMLVYSLNSSVWLQGHVYRFKQLLLITLWMK